MLLYYHSQMRLVMCARSRLSVRPSVCVSVCPTRALTRLDLEASFWNAGRSSDYLAQVRILTLQNPTPQIVTLCHPGLTYHF